MHGSYPARTVLRSDFDIRGGGVEGSRRIGGTMFVARKDTSEATMLIGWRDSFGEGLMPSKHPRSTPCYQGTV